MLKANRKITVFFALLCLAALLTSCSVSNVKAELAQFRAEFPDIKEFFTLIPNPSHESSHAEEAAHSPSDFPILTSVTHTEELPSVYSSTVLADTALSDAEKYGYTAVPRFAANDISTVTRALLVHGIEPTIVTRRNPAPENAVYAIEFAGLSDKDGYYINLDCPVTLYVSAAKPELPPANEDGSNVVYLTYDDGPTYSETIRLLDVLDTYGVKGTFFVIGESVQKYPESAKAIVERGHAIGCHSVTHQYDEIYASVGALEKEILAWEKIMTEAGIPLDDAHKLFRFPGGSVGTYLTTEESAEMKEMLHGLFYRIYDWNVVTNDALLFTAPEGMSTYEYIQETFMETFELKASSGASPIIILMHETVPETIDLMPWMIEYLIGRGYTFALLDTIDSWMFG